MFTGIIETMGELVKVEKEQTNLHFHIRSALAKELKIDQSLAPVSYTHLRAHET